MAATSSLPLNVKRQLRLLQLTMASLPSREMGLEQDAHILLGLFFRLSALKLGDELVDVRERLFSSIESNAELNYKYEQDEGLVDNTFTHMHNRRAERQLSYLERDLGDCRLRASGVLLPTSGRLDKLETDILSLVVLSSLAFLSFSPESDSEPGILFMVLVRRYRDNTPLLRK